MTKKNKLLLVEDEEELIKIVEIFFRDEGFDVRLALNAEQALELLSGYVPDIIISDIKMGLMDGFEFLETLRSMPRLKDVPLIFLAAMDDRSSMERAKKLGAAAFMTKPFDVEELVEKVRELLKD